MEEMLQASIYLKAILPLMEHLVEYDQEAASIIAGENIVLQFEVRNGPSAHLDIRGGSIRHNPGPHPRPDVRLTFKTPQQLNAMFAGEDVRPGIRKGIARLPFLTTKLPRLAERLSYYVEGAGKQAEGPEANRFLVTLGLHAMLAGMATVASDDASLAHVAAATPPGTLLVQVLPDGPYGTFAKTRRQENGGLAFLATFGQPEERPNAVMEFANLDVARQLIDGQLSAIVAIGTGEDIRIRGYLPLIDKANIFLAHFAKIMNQRMAVG